MGFTTVFENYKKRRIQHFTCEASYVYILSGQKFIRNVKNGPFWRPETCGQTVLPDRSLLGPKIGRKYQNPKIQMRHFE